MSTRDDARLTAQERAALSTLEAFATADDPQLAARLRGPIRWTLAVAWRRLVPFARRGRPPAWVLSMWFGIPLAVLGLGLAVVSMSVGWGLGVCGALLAGAGLWSTMRDAGRRLAGRRLAGRRAPDG